VNSTPTAPRPTRSTTSPSTRLPRIGPPNWTLATEPGSSCHLDHLPCHSRTCLLSPKRRETGHPQARHLLHEACLLLQGFPHVARLHLAVLTHAASLHLTGHPHAASRHLQGTPQLAAQPHLLTLTPLLTRRLAQQHLPLRRTRLAHLLQLLFPHRWMPCSRPRQPPFPPRLLLTIPRESRSRAHPHPQVPQRGTSQHLQQQSLVPTRSSPSQHPLHQRTLQLAPRNTLWISW
jgi:hypothetical protein